jgi:hypothetical protein
VPDAVSLDVRHGLLRHHMDLAGRLKSVIDP